MIGITFCLFQWLNFQEPHNDEKIQMFSRNGIQGSTKHQKFGYLQTFSLHNACTLSPKNRGAKFPNVSRKKLMLRSGKAGQ